jgi:cytoskeletal protein CcmA (bactofilin family)
MSLFSNKAEKQEEVQISNSSNIIGKGTVIRGDLETMGNIRIDGKVFGNIKSKSKVALGDGSLVEGNVISQNAEVSGEVKGRLEIAEVLILKPSAVINGDIFTGKLIVETGAVFNGGCQMGDVKKLVQESPLTLNGKAEPKETAKATA